MVSLGWGEVGRSGGSRGDRGGILPDCKQAGLFTYRCAQVCSLWPGLWLKGLADPTSNLLPACPFPP